MSSTNQPEVLTTTTTYTVGFPKFIYWIIFMPAIVVAFIILLVSINYASKIAEPDPRKKRLRVIAGLALVFYLLCSTSYLVDDLVDYPEHFHYVPHNIALILRCLAHGLLYILFSERIRITFSDTVYSSPCYVFLFVYTAITVHVGGHLGVITLYMLDLEMQKHHQIFDTLIQLHFITYVILSMFLLCLFTKKLMLLAVTVADTLGVQSLPNTPKYSTTHMRNKTPKKWGGSGTFAESSALFQTPNGNIQRTTSKDRAPARLRLSTIRAGEQMEWLHLVIKLTILLLCTIILTDCSLIYDTIMYGINRKDIMDDTAYELFHLFRGVLLSVDTISNCMVMFLSFEFAKKYYLRCCCCDKCCNRCCVRITSRRSIQQWAEIQLNRATYAGNDEEDVYTDLGKYELQHFKTTVKLK